MSVADLRALVVDGFPSSARRNQLWAAFEGVLKELSQLKIPCEIWVDGSYLTQKIDPDDIDFVIDIDHNVMNRATEAQKRYLEKINKQAFHKAEHLHSFIMFSTDANSPEYPTSVILHDQWQRDFGYSYIKKQPKGIAVVEVQP